MIKPVKTAYGIGVNNIVVYVCNSAIIDNII